jgi:putative copper resistance protein D
LLRGRAHAVSFQFASDLALADARFRSMFRLPITLGTLVFHQGVRCAMNIDPLMTGQVALTALSNVAFAMAIGAFVFERWLASDGAAMPASPAHPAWQRAHAALLATALVLLLAHTGWLLYEVAAANGTTTVAAIGVVPALIARTRFGYGWLAGFAGAALLLFAALTHRGGRIGYALCWIAAAAFAVGEGLAARAGAHSAFPVALGAALHGLHVLALGAWGGVVMAGGFVVVPAVETSVARRSFIRLAERISLWSVWAALAVLASGALDALRGAGGVPLVVVWDSPWGRVLLLKLALVVLATLLLALARASALPRLRRSASTTDAHTFSNLLHLEAGVMLGLFVASAVLTHSTLAH